MGSLLAPSATPLARATAETLADATALPTPARDAWNPQAIGAPLLPWLAWSVAVDEWNPTWSEANKRTAIAEAFALHRRRGTPWAIKRALSRVVDSAKLIERPEGAHWAEFDVDIAVTDRPLTEDLYPQITKLIDAYKPTRSHLRRLVISVASRGTVYAGCVTLGGDQVTVQPHQVTDITAPALRAYAGIGQYDCAITSIYPRAV